MWFLGLIIGAIIGAIGNGPGAIIGALAGGAAGWLLSAKLKGLSEQRLKTLEASVEYLQERVASLEKSQFSAPLGEPIAVPTDPTPVVGEPAADSLFAAATEESPASASGVAYEPRQAVHTEPAEAELTAAAPEPRADSPYTLAAPSALWNFFFGGNTLVRFGVIVLFFGVAFLLKYAAENIEIPIEARLIGVALGAIMLLAIGWRLRVARPGYGLIVQGGGIGLLYLTVFAAFRLYQLLPAGVVFALLTLMAIFSAVLAVLQDSRSLAAMGVSGGFLAPILASTGGGSHVALFSFYALLNLGIVIVAWYKAWRSLNLLGFAFTFLIGLSWGERYYRSEYFASTEPFLILFFLFYVAIAVLFALRQEASIKSPVDGTLVFGVPLVGFGLQTALVRDTEYATAFSALALSGFYLLLAKVMFARAKENLRLLVESFLALGVVFGTLAIPLALDGRWTAAAWALEGAAIVWVGARQEKKLARAFGIFLQFGAGVAFFAGGFISPGALPFLNSVYLGCLMISIAALFSSWYLKRQSAPLSVEANIAAIALFCWGNLWWFGGGLAEIHEQLPYAYRLHAGLFFVTLSCAAFSLLQRKIDWRDAQYTAVGLLPFMFLAAVVETDRGAHPLQTLGYIVWPLAFAVNLWLLRRHDVLRYIAWWHSAGMCLFAALGAWEVAWWTGELIWGGDVWRLVGWPAVPVVLLAWLSDRGDRLSWPVARYLDAYLFYGAILPAAFLWLWMLHGNFDSNGDPSPLPYLPLLNPLDLAHGAVLLTLFAWFRRLRSAQVAPPLFQTAEIAYVALGSVGFIWLNGVLLRTLHHWAVVPFNFDALMRSMLVQASLSIFWSVLALCTMVAATRARVRPLWIAGAGLMAAVVGKLFFVDLSNVGGIERIVSFIGVGLLMLVIGYCSPVPPVRDQEVK